MKNIVIAFCFIVFLGVAQAQSINETVLYLLIGIDEQQAVIETGQLKSIANKSPDGSNIEIETYSSNQKAAEGGYKFLDIDNCKIAGEVSSHDLRSGEGGSFEFVLNMDKARSIDFDVNGFTVILGATYECKNVVGNLCEYVNRIGYIPFVNFGDKERVKLAFSYYREAFCSGSAF